MEDPTKELSLAELPEAKLPMLPERFQPRNLTELMEWAKMVEASELAPKYKDKNGNMVSINKAAIIICVQLGAEVGVNPAQALQNIYVVNGRPTIFGDLGKAIFRRDAHYAKWEDKDPAEAKKDGVGWCRITMKNGEVYERRFTREMAKEARLYERVANGPWNLHEGTMLQWRAIWRAMRDADPGVFKGLSSAEEQQDIIDISADVRVDGQVNRPRRKSEGVVKTEVDAFLKDVPKTTPPTAPGTQGGGDAMPGKPPLDRSKLRKVMIGETAEKQGGGKTFYEVWIEPSSGPKVKTSTFSKTDYETATALKGKLALIDTKEVAKEKDGKKIVYVNLTYIEDAAEAVDVPPDEPGQNG